MFRSFFCLNNYEQKKNSNCLIPPIIMLFCVCMCVFKHFEVNKISFIIEIRKFDSKINIFLLKKQHI